MNVATRGDSRSAPPSLIPGWLPTVAFIVGVIGLAAVVAIAIAIPAPSPSQNKVFGTVMALAGAAFAIALTGFISIRLNLPAGGRLMAGGSLAVFGVIYFFSPAGPIAAPSRAVVPGEVTALQGAFLMVDTKLRTYFDRARDLKDVYRRAGKDAFIDKQMQLPMNHAIHAYNEIREDLQTNHQRYIFAIDLQASKASDLGSQMDGVLNQVESLHRECVLPLNDLGKTMDKLIGKTGPEVDRERNTQDAKLLDLTSTIELRLTRAEADLKVLERQNRTGGERVQPKSQSQDPNVRTP